MRTRTDIAAPIVVAVPLALVSDFNPGSVRDDGAYAIVTGGSVEFRKAPWQSVS
jgi:hypothetical protein